MLGADAIVKPSSMRAMASTFILHGARKVAIRRGLAPEDATFLVGHELAHVLLERAGYAEHDLEFACDYLGAALMAPRSAMRQLRLSFGDDYEQIADAVCATESWAALRCAEVSGRPTALVTPQSVRVRGGDWVWPDEQRLRALARRGGAGLLRARLHDDPRRVVLAVDEMLAA